MRSFGYVFLGGLVSITLYALFWPVPIDPEGWTPPLAPAFEGIYAENDLLAETEIIAAGHVGGEAVAFDSTGQLYTGLEDGRIIRTDSGGGNVEVFAHAEEPLGMDFAPDGNLIVADASHGLLSINPQGEITELILTGGDEPFLWFNDLDVASDGKIYFSHSSTKFRVKEATYEALEHRPNGSFWVYDPATGEAIKLIDNMYLANGVTLSPNEDFVLISEMNKYRIWRYWLAGPLAGTKDMFIENLPGFPDNITSNGAGTFWLALGAGPAVRATLDNLHPTPFLKKLVLRIPQSLQPSPTHQGYIIGLSLDGNVIYNMQDLSGTTFAPTTSAIEQNGMLYLGSLTMSGVGRIPVPAERLSQRD